MSVQLFQGAEILAPFSVSSEELLYSVKGLNLSEERLSFDSQCFNFSFNIFNLRYILIFILFIIYFLSIKLHAIIF